MSQEVRSARALSLEVKRRVEEERRRFHARQAAIAEVISHFLFQLASCLASFNFTLPLTFSSSASKEERSTRLYCKA